MPVPDHAQENFVREIFGGGAPARQTEEESVKRTVPPLVDFAHTRQISARNRPHQFVIGLIHMRALIRENRPPGERLQAEIV
jgi:hypothetical protein